MSAEFCFACSIICFFASILARSIVKEVSGGVLNIYWEIYTFTPIFFAILLVISLDPSLQTMIDSEIGRVLKKLEMDIEL